VTARARLGIALWVAALAGCGGAAALPPAPEAPVAVRVEAPELDAAEAALRHGDRAGARRLLEQRLEADRSDPVAHARLAELTGAAPPGETSSLAQALEIADAHPYDPRVVLQAGRLLAGSGQTRSAQVYLERVLWLADLDPASAEQASRLLPGVDPAWRERRVIPVHVFADERVRAQPGWRFRLRTSWLAVSNSLREVLDARFVVYSQSAFASEGVGPDLEAIHAALWRSLAQEPRSGILAAFTGQPEPGGPGPHKRGLAEFVGRRATLRIDPGSRDVEIRVLAHEVLHLFGAVHVASDLESLMNPTSEARVLDPYNLRIVRALRQRRFGRAGLDGDVLPYIDLAETRAAFTEALAANLTFRRMGLDRALRSREFSQFRAAREWQEARQLDPHLGDVTRFLAYLSEADGRPDEAVALMETAAELYGPQSPAGRDARAQAAGLRDELQRGGAAQRAP
jgi:Tfp pilus assembly protein PilF